MAQPRNVAMFFSRDFMVDKRIDREVSICDSPYLRPHIVDDPCQEHSIELYTSAERRAFITGHEAGGGSRSPCQQMAVHVVSSALAAFNNKRHVGLRYGFPL